MQIASQYELALDALNVTLRVLKLLTNSNNDNDSNGYDCATPEDSSSKHNNGDDSNVEIADALHKIGVVFREKDDHKQALDHFRSTLDSTLKKIGNYPDDVDDVLLDVSHTHAQKHHWIHNYVLHMHQMCISP